MPDVLQLCAVRAGYGETTILEDVTFSLPERGSLAVLGRNGVGKTTLLLTLMGLTRLQQGRLALQGNDITRLPAWRRAHAGLGWVPQERFMFPSLTVEEHLTVVERPGGPWNLQRVYKVFPRLEERFTETQPSASKSPPRKPRSASSSRESTLASSLLVSHSYTNARRLDPLCMW